MARLVPQTFALVLALLGASPDAEAQGNPFAGGWNLQQAASSLRFQSVKKQTVVESSSFAAFTGQIAPDGGAEIVVALDSVDTKVDLRNVRMRFLFFETFTYPEARVTTRIDPAAIADLETVRRKILMLPFTFDLHGVKKDYVAEVAVTLISDALVSVSSVAPIPIAVADHNLSDGIIKLQEAAEVDIIPTGSVTFDFLFARNGVAPEPPVRAAAGAAAALEAAGNFDAEACLGRFEILSRAGNIEFRAGSATLDGASTAILDQVLDIVRRCPGMVVEIAGHTDSDGAEAANQRLSERRADAVARWLAERGLAAQRFVVKGYGETRPFVPNDSAANKARNRRIEFRAVSG